MSDQELLPCPFCGEKEPELQGGYDRAAVVACLNCGAVVDPACVHNTWVDRDKVIESWNRRASAPGLDREKLVEWLNGAFFNSPLKSDLLSEIEAGTFDAPAASRSDK